MAEDEYTTPSLFKVNRNSEAYARLMEAGFTIDDFKFGYLADEGYYFFRVGFTCVCKRKENLLERSISFEVMEKYINANQEFDIAKRIEEVGAISRKHLEADGFTPEEIEKIRRPYETKIYSLNGGYCA